MATEDAMGLSLLPIALVPHWSAASFSRVGNLSFEAIWQPALQSYQMARVSARWRSLAYGIVNMAMGMAFASVSFAGGYLVAAIGYRPLFVIGIGLSLASALLLSVRLRKERAAEQRQRTSPEDPPAAILSTE